MTINIYCPKCNLQGSLHTKKTIHGNYWRIAHYIGLKGKTRKIKWCYIGKELPNNIKEQVITQKQEVITQEFTQNTSYPEKSKSVFFYKNNFRCKSGRSLVWLRHQPATLTTRVQIPATAFIF